MFLFEKQEKFSMNNKQSTLRVRNIKISHPIIKNIDYATSIMKN